MPSHSYREVENISSLPGPDESGVVAHYVFQYINFNMVPQYVAAGHRFSDCFRLDFRVDPVLVIQIHMIHAKSLQ